MKSHVIEVLRRSELFLGLSDAGLRKIADLPSCTIRHYETRQRIFKAGEEANNLYVLAEGMVNVIAMKSAGSPDFPEQNVIGTITQGGTFGLSALVPPPVRVMSAVAEGYSLVLSISAKELQALFDSDIYIGYEVMRSLVRVIGSKVRNIEQLILAGQTQAFPERPTTL